MNCRLGSPVIQKYNRPYYPQRFVWRLIENVSTKLRMDCQAILPRAFLIALRVSPRCAAQFLAVPGAA